MQSELFHEDIFEALRSDVMACGGPKAVGSALRPTTKPTEAATWINNCLNRTRAEKFDAEDILFIKTLAKEHGSFATQYFEADEIGMTRPEPLVLEDEVTKLQKEFCSAVGNLERIQKQMERFGLDGKPGHVREVKK